MHVLYLLSDLIYHSRYKSSPSASVAPQLQPHMVALFGSAASFANCPRHQRKLLDLLIIWESQEYYSRDYIDKLREAVRNAQDALSAPGEATPEATPTSIGVDAGLNVTSQKTAPFVMPASHGDPATPFYDLPAGNMMPHIIPNSSTPITSELVKPLQFVAGPADGHLVTVVKDFLEDVQRIFDPYTHNDDESDLMADLEVNELGERSRRNNNGDVDAYYGWSRAFCEKMKARQRGDPVPSDAVHRRGRSDSRDSSRGSPRKRRRQYSSSASSRSRSASHERSRFRDRSRSSSRERPCTLAPVTHLMNENQELTSSPCRSSRSTRSLALSVAVTVKVAVST